MNKITSKPADYHLWRIDNIKHKNDVWSKDFNAVLDRKGITWKFRSKVVPSFSCKWDPLFRCKVSPWS